jgi:hypothetical protein
MDTDIDGLRANLATSMAGVQVDRASVLKVGSVLRDEAIRLRDLLDDSKGLSAGLCGGDPVSEDAAAAFTERAQALIKVYYGYVDDLDRFADALADSARAYGHAENDIRAAFRLDI